MNKLNIAIVGAGRIGNRHADRIAEVATLKGVYDILKENSISISKRLNVACYESLDQMLEEKLDLVSICTPNGQHYSDAKYFLSKGINVLVEKPMTLKSEEALDLIKIAEKHNCRLFIVKQNRFNPPIQLVKSLIDEKKLGKILSFQLSCFWNRNEDYYSGSWKGTLNQDGGTLYTQYSHFLDLLIWLFGDVKRSEGYFANLNHKGMIEFEDTGVIALELKSGVLGTINYNVNACSKNMEGSLTIFAERGTIKVGGQYLNEIEYWDVPSIERPILKGGNSANSYGTYQGSMSNHDQVYKNVVDVLVNGGEIATSGLEGYLTVNMIENIYRQRDI